MDFIQANQIIRKGNSVRRKSWQEGEKNAWTKNPKKIKTGIWWNDKYECILAGSPDRNKKDEDKYLDTDGWLYVCRGDDATASDWEQC